MSNDLDAIDPTFLEDLRESNVAVWIIARWLSTRGHHVTIRAQAIRPTADDRLDYGDCGDLEIIQRVEVKRRGFAFTGADDYPFPTVFVDCCHAWDRALPKPYAYLLTNHALTHAAIVKGSTSGQWQRGRHFDKGRDRAIYECPKALAEFVHLA
jgi:hypothetical protein